MKRPIYLDHHATTPVDRDVLEAMLPYFSEWFGNPSSRSHPLGWQAEEAVERARHSVAAAVGAKSEEIVFTSGATESNVLALSGVLKQRRNDRPHLVTVSTEHLSVLETCRQWAGEGVDVTEVGVDTEGRVDPDEVAGAMTERTALVSVMLANNEIGTLAPIAEITRRARARGVLCHTDATQAVGNMPVNVAVLGCDFLSFSAHKIYGPKGVGALYVGAPTAARRLLPMMPGGGQERGWRSGTLNVPGIVGFGRTCELVMQRRGPDAARHRLLRDRLFHQMASELDGMWVNGTMNERLANNLNVSFEGVEGEALFQGLRDLAVSNGSACQAAHRKPSHVLKAIGRSDALAHAAVRFGLGRETTSAEIDHAAGRVVEVVRRLRTSRGTFASHGVAWRD
ncbi:MAG: cysteine desulfurase [Verrucomicrobiales bacterium]|nr:cysteine desulfurase [Verrucomicrobiales bacterium]